MGWLSGARLSLSLSLSLSLFLPPLLFPVLVYRLAFGLCTLSAYFCLWSETRVLYGDVALGLSLWIGLLASPLLHVGPPALILSLLALRSLCSVIPLPCIYSLLTVVFS